MITKVKELMKTSCGDIIAELSKMSDDDLAMTMGGLKTVQEMLESVKEGRANQKGGSSDAST